MRIVVSALERLGGVASTHELLELDLSKVWIDMCVTYRSIIKVRRGVYALANTPELALRALRVGGRLVCVSALEFHGLGASSPRLHVLLRANASRLRGAADVCRHWSRLEVAGTRLAVAPHVAAAQAAVCRENLEAISKTDHSPAFDLCASRVMPGGTTQPVG